MTWESQNDWGWKRPLEIILPDLPILTIEAEVWKKYILLSPHKGVPTHFTDLREQYSRQLDLT